MELQFSICRKLEKKKISSSFHSGLRAVRAALEGSEGEMRRGCNGGEVVRVVAALAVLCGLCGLPAGHGKRIISYGNSFNDTRILWEQTLRVGPPFQGDLYYWWGDDEPFPPEFDLMTLQSGVPVEGEKSGFPARVTPVQSCIAVSDGPLPVLLPEAQAAAAAGKWPASSAQTDDAAVLEQARAVRRHYESTQLRGGARKRAVAGARGRPAIVYITMSTASEEEVNFPAFAQEMLGDVVGRGVRRIAGATELKLMLEDGRAVGAPEGLGGVPLHTTLAELGQKDGGELRITGVSAFESTWPQYEAIKLPLEAFRADQMWPPCDNLGLEDPLNHFTVGSSLKVGVGPEEDNDPSNVVVIVTAPDRRTCVNKHALSLHLESQSTEPVTGQAVDKLFRAQVKAAMMLNVPFMPVYLHAEQKEFEVVSNCCLTPFLSLIGCLHSHVCSHPGVSMRLCLGL